MKIIDFIIYIRLQDIYLKRNFSQPQSASQARVVRWKMPLTPDW